MTATLDKARGFAVSNLVWPDTDRDTAPAVASSLGFRALELAPVKAWGAWEEAMPADAAALRRRFADQQLEIAALQGICHGVEGLALFGPAAARRRLADHLRRVAEFAAACGGVPCVFGAPRIRDPGDLAPEAAMEQAAEFFAAVAPTYHACGSCLSFEANPAEYGCRFATRTAEAAELVRRVDHPGFGLQIDTGGIMMNGEPSDSLDGILPLAVHVHVSEPNLAVPVPNRAAAHRPIAAALRGAGYAGWLSAEMRMVPDWRAALAAAAALLGELYP